VRYLINTGQASPCDRDHLGSSPLNAVVTALLTTNIDSPETRLRQGVELFRLLSSSKLREHGVIGWTWNFILSSFYRRKLNQISPIFYTILSGYLEHISNNPFADDPVSFDLDLDGAESPINQLLTQQEFWPIDMNSNYHPRFPGTHVENDRMMLADPLGLKMEADLKRGIPYLVYSNSHDEIYWSPGYSVMNLLSKSANEEVQKCCLRRLELLYKYGENPRALQVPIASIFNGVMVNQVDISIGLSVENGLREALGNSGWTPNEIQELFDETLYHGLPELIDGTFTYTSQEENRDEYMQNICRFGLGIPSSNAPYSERYYRSCEFSKHTGLMRRRVMSMMDELRHCLERKRVPCSWPEETSLLLVPGIDFPFETCMGGKNESMAEWPCVQKLLEEAGYAIGIKEEKCWGSKYTVHRVRD